MCQAYVVKGCVKKTHAPHWLELGISLDKVLSGGQHLLHKLDVRLN